MDIPADSPLKEIIIQGLAFSVPMPFKTGDTLNEGAAAQLNQVLHENVRNNFAGAVKDAVKDAPDGDVDNMALQKALEEHIEGYEFGVRRGGSFRPVDPVDAEALDIAVVLVKESIKRQGRKVSEFTPAQIRGEAQNQLGRFPQIREKAEAVVAARKGAAAGIQLTADMQPEPPAPTE